MAQPSKTPARGTTAPAKQAPARPTTQGTTRPATPAAPQRANPPAAQAQPKPNPSVPATRTPTAVARGAADVPEHIRQSAQGRGSENIGMEDLVIPRLELVQALSKCLEEGSAAYIEGARPGMLYNSVTRQLYGDQVLVCPVYFRKQWLAWKDQKAGGGFGGAFDTPAEAQARIDEQDKDREDWEAIETAQQIVLIVDTDTYETTEAVIPMARTRMKVSRQWNSLIRVNGFDRFSRIYEVFTVDETNSVNQSYKNMAIRYVDFAPQTVYKTAEDLYNNIASGARKVKVDDAYDDAIPGEAQPSQAADAGGEY